jgi:hypothetical protein
MLGKKISPREELLNLQRQLFEKIDADIQDYLGKVPAALNRYRNDYNRDLKDYERISSKAELIRAVMKSHIVYCGDYHTLRQSQRTVIKILREIILYDRPIVLAIEMVHYEDQKVLDEYMKGGMDDQTFLEKIDYRGTWNFDWPNYKQLFDFAKKYKIPVVALNCHIPKHTVSLKKRDRIASQILVKLAESHPNSLIFTLYGDLHIAREHIPLLTTKLQKARRSGLSRALVIYQNSDNLYWLLASRGLEQQVDVLKISDEQFCVMKCPPWVKLQGYLNWLENRESQQIESGEELDDKEDSYDYYHRLWDMADTIATFLNLKKDTLDEFNVFTSGDIEFLDFLNSHLKKRAQRDKFMAEMIRTEMIYNGTCLLAEEGMIYLSTMSINKSAEKIAQFIHSRSSSSNLLMNSRVDRQALYFGRILIEAIGYIGSKIINYKRKCGLIADHKNMIKNFRSKRIAGRILEHRHISQIVLDHFKLENKMVKNKVPKSAWNKICKQEPRIFFGVTQALGQMLGERLYNAVMDNRLQKNLIKKIFLLPITTKTDNASRYFEFIELLRDVKTSLTSKSERF